MHEKSKNGQTLKKLLVYLKKYRIFILLSLLFAAISVVFTLYLPILTGDAVDLILGAGQVDFEGLVPLLIRMAVVIALTGIAQWLMNICNNHITYHVASDLRTKAFEKLTDLPLKYVDSHPHGDIISRVVADVDQISDGLLMGFTQFFTGILTILGTLVFMIRLNFAIAMVVLVITPVSLVVAAFIANKTYAMFTLQSRIRGEMTAHIDEMIGNQKVVQAFGREEETAQKFDEINQRLKGSSLRATFFSSITNPSTRFVNGLVYAAVGITGAISAINGGISVGQLSAFLNYANQYTKPFNEISGVVTELQNAITCAARVLELIEEEPQVPDAADAAVISQIRGNVDLESVNFSYNPDTELIQNLNLTVRQGQRIAIVGPTGCGKTTLINLLMRFYDVDAGRICMDGRDIREITRKSLRDSYGMVLQETWLKNGTIRENIMYGRADASEEEMLRASKDSYAHSFIKRLPQGYDTVITEDGDNLSAGQKQLLCIARVMLCMPPVLILDEATSSIDTRTEIRIQKAFAKMMEGRTSFIVAHRLSTIQESDQILVMKDGKIIEQGTHGSLLQKQGFYAELYSSQWQQ